MLFESKSVISSFCLCVLKMLRYVTFVIGKLKHVFQFRTFLVLQQQQNLGRRFGTSKMHLSPPVAKAAVHSKAVVLLLLTFCLLLLPLWE